MKLKAAFVRAVRAGAFTMAGALVVVHPAADLVGVKGQAIAQATGLAAAAVYGFGTFCVSFLVNFGEDNTSLQLPKA